MHSGCERFSNQNWTRTLGPDIHAFSSRYVETEPRTHQISESLNEHNETSPLFIFWFWYFWPWLCANRANDREAAIALICFQPVSCRAVLFTHTISRLPLLDYLPRGKAISCVEPLKVCSWAPAAMEHHVTVELGGRRQGEGESVSRSSLKNNTRHKWCCSTVRETISW